MEVKCPTCGEKIEIPKYNGILEDKMRINVRCSRNHLIVVKLTVYEREEFSQREGDKRPRKPKIGKWLKPLEYS